MNGSSPPLKVCLPREARDPLWNMSQEGKQVNEVFAGDEPLRDTF